MKNWNTLEADVDSILDKHFTAGRSGHKIDKVVLHHNAGNLTVEGCYNVWQTREASAHYQVQSDGKIGQLVWDRDTAWHAGDSDANMTSIGIEHANNSTGPWTISDKCLDAGAHLTAAVCKYYNLGEPEWGKNVFPHSYFCSTACPGEIAGLQNKAYMECAKKYYKEMVGKTTAAEKPSASDTKLKYKVGDTVKINGIYESSTSTEKLNPLRTSGKITKIIAESRNPYLLDNGDLGWVNDSVITGKASASSTATIKVGSKVKVVKPVDYYGTSLAVSGTYDVIEVSGNRIVIGKGKAVTAAIHKDNLRLA